MSERSKEGKKEALFREQTGYLRSGVQANAMPKAVTLVPGKICSRKWQGKKSVLTLAS